MLIGFDYREAGAGLVTNSNTLPRQRRLERPDVRNRHGVGSSCWGRGVGHHATAVIAAATWRFLRCERRGSACVRLR